MLDFRWVPNRAIIHCIFKSFLTLSQEQSVRLWWSFEDMSIWGRVGQGAKGCLPTNYMSSQKKKYIYTIARVHWATNKNREWNQGLTFRLRKVWGLNKAERICVCYHRPSPALHKPPPQTTTLIHTRTSHHLIQQIIHIRKHF